LFFAFAYGTITRSEANFAFAERVFHERLEWAPVSVEVLLNFETLKIKFFIHFLILKKKFINLKFEYLFTVSLQTPPHPQSAI